MSPIHLWLTALLADPAHVAAYLPERIEDLGHKPATLRVAAAATAFVHKTAGLDDPCARPEVKRTLRGATRKAGRAQKQAKGLTAEALAMIWPTACDPTGAADSRVHRLRRAGEGWTWRSSASCATRC